MLAASMVQRQTRELEESREVLRLVTENVPQVLFVLSPDARTTRYTSHPTRP